MRCFFTILIRRLRLAGKNDLDIVPCQDMLRASRDTIGIIHKNDLIRRVSRVAGQDVHQFVARRLQIQERLTEQVAEAIQDAAKAEGVGVVFRCRHLCMMMRGVEKQNSEMVTSAMLGSFREDEKVRQEFLSLAK